jgi:hypothetical protein
LLRVAIAIKGLFTGLRNGADGANDEPRIIELPPCNLEFAPSLYR